ncbi:hypothetical protein L1I79_10150 [Strepomyces sp. STD 3.1]|uniref:hypothetical protein n=1 Tax=Streptomyces sp. NPDC058985 TaxID=3346684 RepID=UPI001F1D2C18|nr:hypothetical protein [Streptomyces sp. STD 3.1]
MTDIGVDREMQALQDFRRALHRFQDAMDAIEDLFSFAEEHAPDRIKKSDNFEITLSVPPAGDIPKDRIHAANTALYNFFRRAAETIPNEDLKGAEEDEGIKASINGLMKEMTAELDAASTDSFDAGKYAIQMMHMRTSRNRLEVLRSSLLTTAVGDFEVLFSSIVGMYYHLRPEALMSKEAQFSWQEIQEFESLDDLREFHVQRQVDQLMWKGLDDWTEWLEKRLKIYFADITLGTDRVREVFQRRHIIVHNGGQVSRQYLAKAPALSSRDLEVGDRLSVNKKYLSEALDELYSLGVLMSGNVANKLFRRSDIRSVIHDHLRSDMEARCLNGERWGVAARLSSAYVDLFDSAAEKTAMQINYWVAKKNAEEFDAIRGDVKSWDVSSLRDDFKLAKMLLLDQFEDAFPLACSLSERSDLKVDEYLHGPLYKDLREWVSAEGLESPFPEMEQARVSEIAAIAEEAIKAADEENP